MPQGGQTAARAEAARSTLTEYERKVAKYRAALESDDGPPPALVAGWLREVEVQRLTAEAELAATAPAQPLSEAEIRALVASQRNALLSLADADPQKRATIYAHTLGLSITYHSEQGAIAMEARPACTQVRVGGGTCPPAPRRTVLDLAA